MKITDVLQLKNECWYFFIEIWIYNEMITFKLGELEVTVFVLVIATNCLYLHLMFFIQTLALFCRELL